VAGRGLGSRIRDLDMGGCLDGCGIGGALDFLDGVVVSVDTERMTKERRTMRRGKGRTVVESMADWG